MIITQTPLRISFVGGGTDLPDFYRKHGGAVLSTAIDKYLYVIVKERFDKMIYLNWSKKEIVDHVDKIEHELIREAMKKTGVLEGVEITTLSDIPAEGSGLGSSSSVTVGVLHALYLYQGLAVEAEKLAKEASEIEIDVLGKPIGKQDQYIAAYGGVKHFQFNQDDSVTTTDPQLTGDQIHEINSHLLLFYTGITRKADTILSEQKAKIVDTEAILQEMAVQSFTLLAALKSGDINSIGQALDQGWELKKQLAGGISNPEIDEMYNKAKESGAVGGKVAGAGGGGFLLLYVPLENHKKVRQALANYKEMPFNLGRDGSKAIFNIRT